MRILLVIAAIITTHSFTFLHHPTISSHRGQTISFLSLTPHPNSGATTVNVNNPLLEFSSSPTPLKLDRRDFSSATAAAATSLALATSLGSPQLANAIFDNARATTWRAIPVPFEDTLFDIAFDTESHGYLVGAKGSFAETNDGGETWLQRSFLSLEAEEEVRC